MSLTTSQFEPAKEQYFPDPCPKCTPGDTCRSISCGRLHLKNGKDPKLVRIDQLERRVAYLEDTLQFIKERCDV